MLHPLPLSGLKFRQPLHAKTPCFTSFWFLQERSPETICLPSTGQITLSQGLVTEGTWWEKVTTTHREAKHTNKYCELTRDFAWILLCIYLDSSFDSGLSLNGHLNTCSCFTGSWKETFHLWFENAWNATQQGILHAVFLLLYRAQ